MQCEPTTPATLDNFVRDFESDVPGAGAHARNHLRRSLDDFFTRSLRWRAYHVKTLQPGVRQYEIATPVEYPDSRIVKVIDIFTMTHDGELHPINEVSGVNYRTADVVDWHSRMWSNPTPNVIDINYPPAVPTEVYVQYALSMTHDGRHMPGEIAMNYRETLLSGAKAITLMMPGKDWTSPELAMAHRQIANNGIARAARHYEDDLDERRPYRGRLGVMKELACNPHVMAREPSAKSG